VKVVVFEPDYDAKHRKVLRALAKGIPGAVVRPVTQYEECDVAVIFGGVKRAFNKTWSKAEILERHEGRRLIMVESAFMRRGVYYQVGFGGAAGHAEFNPLRRVLGMDRFFEINGDHYESWQKRPEGPIVVIGQLPRDVQVQHVDHIGWCQQTVKFYADHGEEVWFRPHPKVGSSCEYGVPQKYIDTRPLKEVLAVARAVVTWNSTTGVDAALAGVPVVALDRGSMAWSVAGHSLLHNYLTPRRQQWASLLGYSQWTLAEMRKGLPWRHLTEG
jgi:hypothetical protein